MNSKILYFIGGVIGGCIGTYVAMNRRMEQRIETEIASVKQVYAAKYDGNDRNSETLSENNDQNVEKSQEKSVKSDTESPRDRAIRNAKEKEAMMTNSNISDENGYNGSYINTHKTEYNLFSNPPKAKDIHNGYDENEDLEITYKGEEDEDDPDILDTTPSQDAPGPYVLEDDKDSTASDKFANEEPYFDKITLFLYDDGVLASESEEIIEDVNGTVGMKNLDRIGEFEPDVVYIRNEKKSADYEVIRQYRGFAMLSGEYD